MMVPLLARPNRVASPGRSARPSTQRRGRTRTCIDGFAAGALRLPLYVNLRTLEMSLWQAAPAVRGVPSAAGATPPRRHLPCAPLSLHTGYTPDGSVFPWRRFAHRIPLHFTVLGRMPRAGGLRTGLRDKRSRVIP